MAKEKESSFIPFPDFKEYLIDLGAKEFDKLLDDNFSGIDKSNITGDRDKDILFLYGICLDECIKTGELTEESYYKVCKEVGLKREIEEAEDKKKPLEKLEDETIEDGIIINPDLSHFVPALSNDERNQLEQNLCSDGCRDALVVWKSEKGNVLIDGFHRYEICKEKDIPFETIEMEFDLIEDVKVWIALNQLGRRNLNNYQRSKLVLVLKEVYKKEAEERRLKGKKNKDGQTIAEQGKTVEKLGEIADVSGETIRKVEKIEEIATLEQKKQLESGEKSITKVHKEVIGANEYVNYVKKIHSHFDKILDYINEAPEEQLKDIFRCIKTFNKVIKDAIEDRKI